MKLVYQYIPIFFNFYTTSNHLHPLLVENCDSNSRLVVDGDDNCKFRLKKIKVVGCGGETVGKNPSHNALYGLINELAHAQRSKIGQTKDRLIPSICSRVYY